MSQPQTLMTREEFRNKMQDMLDYSRDGARAEASYDHEEACDKWNSRDDVKRQLLAEFDRLSEQARLLREANRKLVRFHSVIAATLGDSDPCLPDDYTEEDVRNEWPLFWVAVRLAEMIGDAPWDSYFDGGDPFDPLPNAPWKS